MHELEKLEEAEYFYHQVLAAKDKGERDAFKHNLSAFLSAARSVLQYALEESKTTRNGKLWYDSKVSGNSVVSFFKDKRDINIHIEPIKLRQDVNIRLAETLRLSGSILQRLKELLVFSTQLLSDNMILAGQTRSEQGFVI